MMAQPQLDASLEGLLAGFENADRLRIVLDQARIRSALQLKAWLRRYDADAMADKVILLALHYPTSSSWCSNPMDRQLLRSFYEFVQPFVDKAADAQCHTMMVTNFRSSTSSLSMTPHDIPPEISAPAALGGDRKRIRLNPITIDEILPPIAGKKTISRQDWEDGNRRVHVYRLARIAQRAGSAAQLWDSFSRCEDPADRQKLWIDTLGAGAWRSLRAVVYAFEAFERWALRESPPAMIYPADIFTVIKYMMFREKKALKDGKIRCPRLSRRG